MESTNSRRCSKCGSFDSSMRRNNISRWYHDNNGGYLCHICYCRKYKIEHREEMRYYDGIFSKLRIQFRERQMRLKFNPRKNKCQRCGKKGYTMIFRLRGHDNMLEFEHNPLGFIIELCRSCARKEKYIGS